MEDGRDYILTVEGQKNLIAPADGGPAAELSPDFFSISRDVYESVFAMGLGEMQSLDPLNSSDVAARFFAAGAGLGSASLPKLLSLLDARQNELYRPWGNARSASAVNRLLASMGETDAAIRDLRERNGAWRRMKDDLSAMEDSIEKKKERLEILKGRIARLELLEKARPSRKALEETELRLAGMTELRQAELVADSERDEAQSYVIKQTQRFNVAGRRKSKTLHAKTTQTIRTDENARNQITRNRRELQRLNKTRNQQTGAQRDGNAKKRFHDDTLSFVARMISHTRFPWKAHPKTPHQLVGDVSGFLPVFFCSQWDIISLTRL